MPGRSVSRRRRLKYARHGEDAIEQEIDEILEEVHAHRPLREEHAEIDRRQERLDQQIGVDISRQLAASNRPRHDSDAYVKALSPELPDLVANVRRFVGR